MKRLHSCDDCSFETTSYAAAIRHTEESSSGGHLTVPWIVHGDRRRHLLDLAGECVPCLKSEIARLRSMFMDDIAPVDPVGDLVEIFRDVYGPTTDGLRLRGALDAVQKAVNLRWLDALPPGALMCGCGDIVQTDHQCANCEVSDV